MFAVAPFVCCCHTQPVVLISPDGLAARLACPPTEVVVCPWATLPAMTVAMAVAEPAPARVADPVPLVAVVGGGLNVRAESR